MKKQRLIFSILFVMAMVQFLPKQALALPNGFAYTYDASGNRLSRTFTEIQLKMGDTTETKAMVGNYNVTFFPNPTKSLLTFRINNLAIKDADIKVIISDNTGNVLVTNNYKNTENIVDLSKYTNGTYFFTVIIGEQTETFKVMKLE